MLFGAPILKKTLYSEVPPHSHLAPNKPHQMDVTSLNVWFILVSRLKHFVRGGWDVWTVIHPPHSIFQFVYEGVAKNSSFVEFDHFCWQFLLLYKCFGGQTAGHRCRLCEWQVHLRSSVITHYFHIVLTAKKKTFSCDSDIIISGLI